MYFIIKTAYYIGIGVEVVSNGTFMCSLIVICGLISFPCINLMSYLCIVFIKLFVFYCHDSFLLYLLLF